MSSSPVLSQSPRIPRFPSKDKRKASMLQTSGDQKSPDRVKRSKALIEEQVILIKDTQDVIERILEDIEQRSGSGFDKREEELQMLLNKSQELLVMLQIMMRIRNELAYARIDLEKAIKADYGIETAKKRVKWLQQRLEKLLSTTKSYFAVSLSPTSKYLKKCDVSERMWSLLSDDQRERYFKREGEHDIDCYRQDSMVLMDDFTKMVLDMDPNDGLVCGNFAEKAEEKRQRELVTEDKRFAFQKTVVVQSKKKKKKRKEISSESSSKVIYPITVPLGDLYDGDGDSSPEPISESELDDNDNRSSISSSVGIAEVEIRTRPASESQHIVRTLTMESKADPGEEKEKKTPEYWDSDHHKFEWSDYMLKLDPRSWHALGIAVQDSFISKEKHQFDSNIPWKEKPMKVNSVIDVHKIALDKLLLRLHRIYEAIGQATQATIDPVPRNERMETVMGKREDVASSLEEKVAAISRATSASREVILPPLPEGPTKSVPMMSMSPELKPSNRKSTKYFPRQSKEWCEDIKSGHDMPRLVTFKPPPIIKKMSSVQPRYLGRKSGDLKDSKPAFSLFRKDEWKPAVIKRLVGAMRAFDSSPAQRDKTIIEVEEGTPRWRRLVELLGESGLKSSNQTIATEAAKAVGQLTCRHPMVLEALSDTINDLSREPRVLYETSKALILLGHWSPQAMKVIIEHIKKGNELVVKELLETMTKAKNIPFVDQSTPEFKSLAYLLVELVKVDYHPVSYRAAIGLGKLCVVEPVSKEFLMHRFATLTAEEKSEALLVLIKQMNCKDKYVLEMLLDHLCSAHNWKNRLQAAELLIFIGARNLFKVLSTEKVFDVLERLLWDHSNKELRAKIAEVINVLGLRQSACSLVLRRLEDPNEEVRARSVISLATLGMKGVRELKALLDILELDSSVYVRIQVIRAFSQLKWNDPRIIRSLRERDRGDSTLASEARKAITKLTEEERPSNTRQSKIIEA